MSMNTILLAVGKSDEDRTDELVETVIDIAEPTGATVVLAHVFEESEYEDVRAQLGFAPDDEVTPDDVAKRYVTIRELSSALEEAGVDFAWHGAVGEKGDRIVDLADHIEADLVVVGGRKRSPTGKAVFGSTAQQIMMESPAPVTFVRGDEVSTEDSRSKKLLGRVSP